jgi:hypothetical protein
MKKLLESIAIIVFIGTLNLESLGRPPDWAYCPGDINNNQMRNGIDITYGISYFNGGNVPPFCAYDDSTGDSLYLAGDVNGNCLFTISDIIFLRTYLLGGPLPQYCPYMRPNGDICSVNNNPPWDTTGVFFDPGIPDTLIIGNLDGSLIAAHPGDTLFIPIWLKNDQSVAAMVLPIGTSDVYFSSRLGGIINSPLTRFGTALFLNPESSQPVAGFTTQTLSCWAVEHRDSLLNTLGIYKQVAEIRAVVTGDSSTIGDTTFVIQGFHPRVGLITMSDSVGLNEWNPVVIPGKVYICPSICNIPNPSDFHIIFGNKDGSAMSVRPGDTIDVPVWGATSPDTEDMIDSVTMIHIPLATNDSYIASRIGGYFPDTLVGLWDDRSFLTPDPNSPSAGRTSQSMLGLAWLTDPRDPQNFLYTSGDTVLICTYRMVVTTNQAYGGQTICPFQQGINPANGGLIWMMQDGLSSVVPIQTYGCLYFDSTGHPGVVSTAPSRNMLNSPPYSDISVTFDFPINLTTLTDSTFVVNASMTGKHRGVFSLDGTGMIATLNPEVAFTPGEVVTITLTTGISSIYRLNMSKPYQWSFTVATAPNAEPLFRSASYHTGDSLYSIFAADLDNDSDIDLIASDHLSNRVSVFLNNGTGSFSFDSSYALENGPRSVCAVDLDGDGDMDIAAATEHAKKISILSNNGYGEFSPATTISQDKAIFTISCGDFDRDGDMDLTTAFVSGGTGEKREAVLINHGNFSFAATYHQTTDGTKYSMVVTDLDNVGGLDIATALYDKAKVWVSWNTGTGTFSHMTGYSSGSNPRAVCAGDIDDDGDNDLLVSNSSTNDISRLLNNGDSTFSLPTTYNVGAHPYDIKLSDVDGDGNLDVITSNQNTSSVSVLLNNGSGEFSLDTTYGISGQPCSIVASDFNGDGRIDLAVADQYYDSVFVFLSHSIPVPGTLTGIISDDSAQPINGVYVIVDSLSVDDYSDSTGVYFIDSLPPAIYSVLLSHPDYRDTTITNIVVSEADTTVLNVTLEELPGVIIGTVADEEANAIEGVGVEVLGTVKLDTSNAQGQYEFSGVQANTYSIAFSQPDYYDSTVSGVLVTPGDTTILSMVMKRLPGIVTGVAMTPDSIGIEGVQVAVVGTSQEDTTDAEGYYDLSGLLAGNFNLAFSHPDYFDTTITNLSITPGDTTILNMVMQELPGVITGKAMTSDSVGIEGVLVTVVGLGIDTLTDSSGFFRINGLEANSYDVLFSHPDFGTISLTGITVTPGDTTNLDAIMSELRGVIQGTVRNINYVAIEDVWVSVLGTSVDDSTNSEGKYLLDSLSSGIYDIRFSSQFYGDIVVTPITVSPGDTTILDIILLSNCNYVVGDVNNSQSFTGLDVTYSVRYFKGGPMPPYSCFCPLHGTWYVSGDVNGSCSFTGLDVTFMVRYFKGGPHPIPCADCPPAGLLAPLISIEEPTPAIQPKIVPSLKAKGVIKASD